MSSFCHRVARPRLSVVALRCAPVAILPAMQSRDDGASSIRNPRTSLAATQGPSIDRRFDEHEDRQRRIMEHRARVIGAYQPDDQSCRQKR